MKVRLILLTSVLIITACNNSRDFLDKEFNTLLPCNIGTFKHGKSYTINYNEFVEILHNDYMIPVYPELNHKEIFLTSFKFSYDSVDNLKGRLEIEVDSYIRLFADTVNGTFYRIGPYYFSDYKIDSINLKRNSIDFRIYFGDEKYNRISYCQIVRSKNNYYLKLNNSFLGDLVTKDNPMYSYSKDGFNYHRLDTNRKNLFDTKIEFYKNHIQTISELIPNESIQGNDKEGLINSYKYLEKVLKLYESADTTKHNN